VRNFIIAGNWKMNTTPTTGVELARSISDHIPPHTGVKVLLFPPATHLSHFQQEFNEADFEYGGQNVHWENSGAYTGEFSPEMLLELGCKWVIVGHSERRKFFGETDQSVNKRLLNTLNSSLSPILCIGETLTERESNLTYEVLERQIKVALENLTDENAERLVVAYEPVWAIGTGHTATTDQAQEAHHFIRNVLAQCFSGELANNIVVQYGGSVNAGNALELMSCPDVDGALIGGASLKPDEFIRIIEIADSLGG